MIFLKFYRDLVAIVDNNDEDDDYNETSPAHACNHCLCVEYRPISWEWKMTATINTSRCCCAQLEGSKLHKFEIIVHVVEYKPSSKLSWQSTEESLFMLKAHLPRLQICELERPEDATQSW